LVSFVFVPHLPTLKTIPRGLIVIFRVCIGSPSTIFPHHHLLHSSSLFPQVYPLKATTMILENFRKYITLNVFESMH
jgi:hypothetical protein